MKTIGIGVVGFWHVHANDYAREVREHPGTDLVVGWDRDAHIADEGAAELGIDLVPSLDALLGHAHVDAVTITTATADHTDVIRRAIRAGKHVFTEKLLAPTVEECIELIDEAEAAGVQLVVSLPQLGAPPTVAVRSLIDEGALGTVTYARVRVAHDGWLDGWLPERFADAALAIGGAFADLGCHPAYLVQHFLGARPQTVAATYGAFTRHAVEDNAVVVLGYANGAVGVAEASFVTTPGAFALEVRGTDASVLFGFGREALIGKGGRFGDAWTELALPEAEPTPFQLWIEAIRDGADLTTNHEAAVELTRLVVAANASSGSARSYDAPPS
ncbi:Gfo/Idh/MocA family protein [Microbacterium sp. P02]|uniref:Gfo/Idh/MocA family protein n=1 Tax=unclassified Microbacterium TaxID=2609290 RepID=UPI00366B3A77